jgi:predicted metalloprotease with PDZ domain
MSEHLWMYEGVTEYFAIFSNQSGLIPEEEFYAWPKRLKMQML